MASLCILFSLTLILSILGGAQTVSGYPVSLSGCPDKCGNMSVPYPFGTQQGCYLEENFLITCNDTSYNPPKAFLGTRDIEVVEIMVLSGELRSLIYIAHQCFDSNGTLSEQESNSTPMLTLGKFSVSYSKNEFMVIGCDTFALFQGPSVTTGCTASCTSLEDVVNGTCAGIGCCQTSISRRATDSIIGLGSLQNYTKVSSFDRCGYAFLVEEAAYNFSSLDFTRLTKVKKFPVILDWTIGNLTCEEAKQNLTSYLCSENSYCYESDNGPGYRCNCTQGYEGNPYLQNGCHDIDECTLSQPCNGTCINFPGGYNCSCPEGYTGNGRKDGNGCTPIPKSNRNVLILALGIGMSLGSVLLFIFIGGYKLWQRRKETKEREGNYERNGGKLLEQQLSTSDFGIGGTKIFSKTELEKAADNFNDNRVLGRGGQGILYKGMLSDGRIVAIKKCRKDDERPDQSTNQFINEVVVMSNINHRHIVKVLGVCLETKVPLLVYEYVPNGTLEQHIHNPTEEFHITWKMRFQIALDSAGALAYLHSSSDTPTYHRDIKSSNILLDEKYKAKISDFGISKNISVEQTHVTTAVQGTYGYLDPEYYQLGKFTDKSDVYSFGVVLLELLTSKRPISTNRAYESQSLVAVFLELTSTGSDELYHILDTVVLQECPKGDIETLVNLTKQCLSMHGRERPTMREVAMTLEMINGRQNHLLSNASFAISSMEKPNEYCWSTDQIQITKDDHTYP